jgi:LruC domain-containing protein
MKYAIGFLFITFLLADCHKLPEYQSPDKLKELVAPADFNWGMTKVVTVNLHNVPSEVIRITSEDDRELYMKCMGNGTENEMQMAFIVPSIISKIKINQSLVEIKGSILEYTFPHSLKSASSTNYSMSFNGTGSWISVPGGSNLTFTNQCSVSAWIKASRHQSAKIIQKGDWDGLGLGQDLWNGWQTSIAFSDGTSVLLNWNAGRPVLNQWYHLAGTYDGTTAKLYVDGVIKATANVSKTIRANTRIISIGSDAGNQKFFQGSMDEVTIWNMAMTPEQVTTARSVGFIGTENGLKGYWKFNEGSGTSSYDLSSDHYHGNNVATSYNTDVGYFQTSDLDNDGVADIYDDYPSDNTRAFNNYMPSSEYNSLAFEDLWPVQGDYDFNDLVVGYKFNSVTNGQNKIVETDGSFVVLAIGGSYKNGFGFSLPGCAIPGSSITCNGTVISESYISLMSNGLETGQLKPTIIVFDNAHSILQGHGGTTGVNVEEGSDFIIPDTVNIHISYPLNLYTLNQLNLQSFNPFMIVNRERGKEIHLADYPPTTLADPTYLGTMSDNSNPALNRYYKTRNNLPWALNVPGQFEYPSEKQDILNAYLKLSSWAISGGNQYADWYLNHPGYRNSNLIYQQ